MSGNKILIIIQNIVSQGVQKKIHFYTDKRGENESKFKRKNSPYHGFR